MLFPTKTNRLKKAIESGDHALVEDMLKASPHLADKGAVIALAFQKGSEGIVDLFTDMFPVDRQHGSKWTFLHFAAAAGCLRAAQNCVGKSPHLVHFKSSSMARPLHIAAERGHVEIAKFLLQNGAEVDAKNSDDETALNLAAAAGQADVVKLLLEYGADANASRYEGLTPMQSAEYHGYSNIITILLEYKNSAPPRVQAPVQSAPAPVAETPWRKIDDLTIAHVREDSDLGYRLTDIFNFGLGRCVSIQRNLDTDVETAVGVDMNELAGRPLLERAAAELTRLGGQAQLPPSALISKQVKGL